MVERELDVDPTHTFECFECGNRETADNQPIEYPDSGDRLRDVSKPRI